MSDSESTRVWAYFRDASGLAVRGRVQIAGIPVGEIDGISLEGTRAKVWLKIRNDVDLREDAVVTKRSESLLGDYLLDLNPGTEGAPTWGRVGRSAASSTPRAWRPSSSRCRRSPPTSRR